MAAAPEVAPASVTEDNLGGVTDASDKAMEKAATELKPKADKLMTGGKTTDSRPRRPASVKHGRRKLLKHQSSGSGSRKLRSRRASKDREKQGWA